MRVYLITGGAGFIGSHLAEALLHQGHRVVVLDDFSSGSLRNIGHLNRHPRFELVVGSVGTTGALTELVAAADVVYHLAATVGVFNIMKNPVASIANNVGGTEAVLKAAAVAQTKVVVASTSEVYGKSTAVPFREDDDVVLGPTRTARWSYAASKMVDEFLALAYADEFGVPAVVVRLFNVIGPRQVGRYGMVVPRFIGQALQGKDLTVYGTGEQSRSFAYVADIVDWLVLLGNEERAVGEVINLGNPEEVTIAELAQRVIALTGARVGVTHIPYEKAYDRGFEDMPRRVPDIRKVLALTGHAPRVGLDEALRRTRDWFVGERTVDSPASVVVSTVAV